MFAFRIDTNGAYDLSVPESPEALIVLAETYLAHEESLPEASRLSAPSLAAIRDLTSQLLSAMSQAGNGEATRATAASEFDQLLEQARTTGGLAIDKLKGMYAENPAQLEYWGIATKKTAAGKISVSRPRTVNAWVTFLETYVAQETRLSAEEQVKSPSLEQMKQLQTSLTNAYASRGQGYTQRLVSNSTKAQLAESLQDTLEVAAANLIVLQFERKVVRELMDWGFPVVERAASKKNGTAGSNVS